MNILLWILSNGGVCLADAYIWYRFLNRTLHRRYSPIVTFWSIAIFNLLYGQANVTFRFAGTIIGNNLYYCFGYFLLCLLLFYGDIMKIAFFAVLLECGFSELSHLLLPLLDIPSPLAQALIPFLGLFFFGLLFELLGRRFQNLKYELPRSLAAYLIFVTLFVFTATTTITELSMMANEYYQLPFPIHIFYNLFAVCGTLVIALAAFTIDKQIAHRLSEQGMSLQLANLKEKEVYWGQLASFRHDIKNHLSCLKSLMQEGKQEEAFFYLDTLTNTVKQLDSSIFTGNAFADAILHEKYAVMTDKKISFTEEICLPEKCRLEPVELCCIFSNLLDNAIYACEQLPAGKRWIKARAFVRQSQLVIVIENSVVIDMPTNRTSKRDSTIKEGIGLSNVRSIIEKYGGVMELAIGHTFTFSAMVPLD